MAAGQREGWGHPFLRDASARPNLCSSCQCDCACPKDRQARSPESHDRQRRGGVPRPSGDNRVQRQPARGRSAQRSCRGSLCAARAPASHASAAGPASPTASARGCATATRGRDAGGDEQQRSIGFIGAQAALMHNQDETEAWGYQSEISSDHRSGGERGYRLCAIHGLWTASACAVPRATHRSAGEADPADAAPGLSEGTPGGHRRLFR